MSFQPIHDYVLVKPNAPKEKTESGILLPESVSDKERAITGTVVAVGPGVYFEGKRIAVDVEVGQSILYNKSMTREITVDGGLKHIVREADILGIM